MQTAGSPKLPTQSNTDTVWTNDSSSKFYSGEVRYQTTFREIKNNTSQKSLLQIAFECGYYDHSHLTNEMKRYTGVAPAQL